MVWTTTRKYSARSFNSFTDILRTLSLTITARPIPQVRSKFLSVYYWHSHSKRNENFSIYFAKCNTLIYNIYSRPLR